MSTEKNGNRELPFNCQIAAVLGWTGLHQINGLWVGFDGQETKEVPGFGETFCSTGPLIQRFQILLGPEYTKDGRHVFADQWSAKLGEDRTGDTITYGKTACEAVGNLLLKVLGEKK
jgi:hypothetical protein